MNCKDSKSGIVPRIKSFLKKYEYDDKIMSFEELWAFYRRGRTVGERQDLSHLFNFRIIGIAASSLIVLTALITWGIIGSVQKSVNDQLAGGKLFLLSMSDGDPVFKRKGKTISLYTGKPVLTGDVIATGQNGSCDIQIVKRALVRVEKNTEVAITGISGGNNLLHASLRLDRGCIILKPGHIKKDESFTVETPSASISVTGTRFMAEVDGEGRTLVTVDEGEVKIKPLSPGNGIIELKAGRSVTIAAAGKTGINNLPVKSIDEEQEKQLNLVSGNDIIEDPENTAILKFNSPAGASIYIDGRFKGYAPLLITVSRDEKINIKLAVDGSGKYYLTGHEIKGNEKIGPPIGEFSRPGEKIWKKEANLSGSAGNAAIDSGRIYVSDEGKLKIFSSSGELLNSINVLTGGGSLTRPVVDEGTVYVGSDQGGLYAFTLAGQPLWNSQEAGKEAFGAFPAAGYGIAAAPSFDKGILVYKSGGSILESIPLAKDEPVYSSPLIIKGGSELIYGTEKGDVALYDLVNKKEIRKKAYAEGRILFPVTGDDRIAIVLYRNAETGPDVIIGIDPAGGDVLWQKALPEPGKANSNPLFTPGKAIFASGDRESRKSHVLILNPFNGVTISSFSLNGLISDECIYDGNLYMAAGGGVFCYDLDMNEMAWERRAGFNPGPVAADDNGVYVLGAGQMSKFSR